MLPLSSASSCFSSLRYVSYHLVAASWELEAMARIGANTLNAGHTGCDLLTTKNFSPTSFMCP